MPMIRTGIPVGGEPTTEIGKRQHRGPVMEIGNCIPKIGKILGKPGHQRLKADLFTDMMVPPFIRDRNGPQSGIEIDETRQRRKRSG